MDILRFEDPKYEICIMLATRIARIVAVPRSVLPATVVFLHGYAFEVPQARLHRDSLGS